VKTGPGIDSAKLPRGFGSKGGLFCPVCRQEAYKQGINESELKLAWFHEGRSWPCVRRLGARPVADTTTES